MRILLGTEGTYPYSSGGVSTWAHALVTGLAHHDFTVDAVVPNPHVRLRYDLPPNARLRPIPLWGSERIDEYVERPGVFAAAGRTTRRTVERGFLPHLERLVGELLVVDGDAEAIGDCVAAVAEFSIRHDLRRALRHEAVWAAVLRQFARHPLHRRGSVQEATDLARSLYRYLTPLALPPLDVDVAHSSAAAFCALPGLVAKLRSGTPFVVSEHGIYLRERILQFVRDDTPVLRKLVFGNLYRGVVQTVYRHADLVVPVCAYNTLWERHLAVAGDRIRVIHNGVEPGPFLGARPPAPDEPRPTVTFVGRIDPLKDVVGLIRAAVPLRAAVPDVLVRLVGGESDAAYARACREAVARLGLQETVTFDGPTDDVAAAYASADVVVLPSLSEGFPFSIVEAMMSGRPVVATRVGGVAEALDDEGLLVPPQNPRALAEALVKVLRMSDAERDAVGSRLRKRALARFTRRRFLDAYAALYEEMSARAA